MIDKIINQIFNGINLEKESIMKLNKEPVSNLTAGADEIRRHFCGNSFDICAIINAKSGKCPENCKFCAQSAHHNPVSFEEYPLLNKDRLLKDAQYHDKKGLLRYGVVTSGKQLNKEEIDALCQSYTLMRDTSDIYLCGSLGLLEYSDLLRLKDSGMSRYHNNLETSRGFFPQICTTHTYDQKIATIQAAQKAGLDICSGGIIGLGETMEDRIDMALTLRELGIKSIPLNILNPIKGTPLESVAPLENDEILRTIAIFRFILPQSVLRLAGGRGSLADCGKTAFASGANGAISGDMLTTTGISIDEDFAILKSLGYEVQADE